MAWQLPATPPNIRIPQSDLYQRSSRVSASDSPVSQPNGKRPASPQKILLLVVLVTAGLRGLVYWASPNAFSGDPDAYRAIAATLDQFGVFGLSDPLGRPRAIAFRPPLYPWLLSLLMIEGRLHPLAAGGLHLVLAVVTSLAVFSATGRLLLRHGQKHGRMAVMIPAAAGLLTACDPILLRQSTEVMTETLAACLASLVIWFWISVEADSQRRSEMRRSEIPRLKGLLLALGLGSTLALAFLCRPTFLVWAALLIGGTILGRPSFSRWVRAGLITLVVATTVWGWTERNRQAIGHRVWATTHGGYTLLLANNESFYDYLNEGRWGQPWDADQFLHAHAHRYEGDPRTAEFWRRRWNDPPTYDPEATEYSDDRLCYQAAVATIKRRPGDFVWSTVVRFGRLWSPFPHDIQGRSGAVILATGAFYLLLYASIVIAVIRHGRLIVTKRWWAIWLLVIALSGVHAVYWSNLRMRAPAMPGLAIAAAFALLPRKGRQQTDGTQADAARVKSADSFS